MAVDTEYMRLLPDRAIKAVGRLELIARTPKEGFVTGRHKSPNKGFSVEFAEHRAYAPGDDLRNLDWRVLGRTDRLYVKEFVEETNMRATILLDVSGSMGYVGECAAEFDGKRLSKFEYARYLGTAMKENEMPKEDFFRLSEKVFSGKGDFKKNLTAFAVDVTLRARNTFIEGNTYEEILFAGSWAKRAWAYLENM